MNFAAKFQIIAVDESVDDALLVGAFGVFRIVNTAIGSLAPHHATIATRKVLGRIQKRQQTTGIFVIIKRLHDAMRLVETIPTCAKDPRMPHGRLVGKECPGIRQMSVVRHKAKRLKVTFLKREFCLFVIGGVQHLKGEVPALVNRRQGVPRTTRTLQHETIQLKRIRFDAFITNTNICGETTLVANVVRG